MQRTYRAVLADRCFAFSLDAPLTIAVIPLLLAATPIPLGSPVPYQEPAGMSIEVLEGASPQGHMQTFDPVVRAELLVGQIPRQWSGTYQPFNGSAALTAQINLSSVTAMGQMIDVRGEMTVGSTTVPVQGNFNANTDQLDLLLLGAIPAGDLDAGGEFLGLQMQGFNLSGWSSTRLTNPGGQLSLSPVAAAAGAPAVRGLW